MSDDRSNPPTDREARRIVERIREIAALMKPRSMQLNRYVPNAPLELAPGQDRDEACIAYLKECCHRLVAHIDKVPPLGVFFTDELVPVRIPVFEMGDRQDHGRDACLAMLRSLTAMPFRAYGIIMESLVMRSVPGQPLPTNLAQEPAAKDAVTVVFSTRSGTRRLTTFTIEHRVGNRFLVEQPEDRTMRYEGDLFTIFDP